MSEAAIGGYLAAELRRLADAVEKEHLRDPFDLVESGHLWIRTKPPDSRLIPLDLTTMTEPQKRLYLRIKTLYREGKPIRIRILKARQMGFSTIIQAILFSFVVTKSMSSLVVANDAENSEWLFQMSKRFHDIIRDRGVYDIPELKRSTLKMISLKGTDSEIRHGTAESPNLGTTVTRGGAHLSEYAFYRNPGELMAKILGSIPNVAGTIIIVETTGHGTNLFYDDWTDEEREPGSTGFENFFFGWTEHPEYRIESAEPLEEQRNKYFAKYEKELRELHGCDDAQIRWFRAKLKEYNNNLPAFQEHFPAKPSEAFRLTGVTVFESIKETLTRIVEARIDEGIRGHFATRFVTTQPHTIQVIEEPRPFVSYCVGADVAEGLTDEQVRELHASGRLIAVKKTFSTATVRRCDTRQLVALMETQEPVGPFGEQLWRLATWYNQGLLGIECNNAGHAVIEQMFKTGYPNLYCSAERRPEEEYRQTRDWGWQTKSNTRGKMEVDWENMIRDNPKLLPSARIARQALTHVVLGVNRSGPMRNCFNDLLFADMICVQMLDASGLAGVSGGNANLLNKALQYYQQHGIKTPALQEVDY